MEGLVTSKSAASSSDRPVDRPSPPASFSSTRGIVLMLPRLPTNVGDKPRGASRSSFIALLDGVSAKSLLNSKICEPRASYSLLEPRRTRLCTSQMGRGKFMAYRVKNISAFPITHMADKRWTQPPQSLVGYPSCGAAISSKKSRNEIRVGPVILPTQGREVHESLLVCQSS